MSKKPRKPAPFGVENGVFMIGFDCDKVENVINIITDYKQDFAGANLWMDAKIARFLAQKLLKAAEYFEHVEAAND